MSDGQPRTPLTAIRAKCIDCHAGGAAEVRRCPVTGCPLFPFRFGKDPFRQRRHYTPKERREIGERLRKAREAKRGH